MEAKLRFGGTMRQQMVPFRPSISGRTRLFNVTFPEALIILIHISPGTHGFYWISVNTLTNGSPKKGITQELDIVVKCVYLFSMKMTLAGLSNLLATISPF